MARINIRDLKCLDCGCVFASARLMPDCPECNGCCVVTYNLFAGASAAADFEGPVSDDKSFYRPSPFRRLVLVAAANELDRRASGGV